MDNAGYTVTLDEFKIFHGIDRALYLVLVKHLSRNPSESLQVMGLWLWLERGGFCNVISTILTLPTFLINELADEALACIKCINDQLPLLSEFAEIPLTHSLVKKDISLHFFRENRLTAYHEVQNLISEVCIPALSDIMERARHGGFGESSTRTQMMIPSHAASSSSTNLIRKSPPHDHSFIQSFSSLNIRGEASTSRGRSRAIDASRYQRTMFVTFSKGYPVTENEVRMFFTRLFGNCIESLYMQEVSADEQALYARIVFLSPSFIEVILNGVNKAKFTINGKHVWMRKFVPKNVRTLPCGCPSVGTSTCPHR